MGCNPNPFPLNSADARDFQASVGLTKLYALPSWGGMFVWNQRMVLVYLKPDTTFAFTDISGGIPNGAVPGGCIPANVFIKAFTAGYVSPIEAFLVSLPSNFLNIAKQRFEQMIEAGDYFIDAAGNVVTKVVDDIIKPIAKPLEFSLGMLAIIAVAVAAFVYLPKRK